VVKPAFAPTVRAELVEPEATEGQPQDAQTALRQAQGERILETGRAMVNPDQYFEDVPLGAWEFHIGGYQPAQKWLKDQKGRALSFEDVMHYQKIINILTETDRIMQEMELPL
jgi:Type ISP C-terminal specificity domain